jgi:Ca2+-binding EF-hand superfamily protein
MWIATPMYEETRAKSRVCRAAMARLGLQMTAAEIAKMIEEADANHDGKIGSTSYTRPAIGVYLS